MGTGTIRMWVTLVLNQRPPSESVRWSRAMAGNSSGSSPYPCNIYYRHQLVRGIGVGFFIFFPTQIRVFGLKQSLDKCRMCLKLNLNFFFQPKLTLIWIEQYLNWCRMCLTFNLNFFACRVNNIWLVSVENSVTSAPPPSLRLTCWIWAFFVWRSFC